MCQLSKERFFKAGLCASARDSVRSPAHIVYPAVKDLVETSPELRIKLQGDDRRWPLGWSFGDDARLQSLRVKYEAYYTLQMLVQLKAFGRIE